MDVRGGALDAYFCDAYTDIVAAAIISKSRHQGLNLPDFFYDIKFPVRAIIEPYMNNVNWRWRMAARKMMERENVLSLDTIQKLFNKLALIVRLRTAVGAGNRPGGWWLSLGEAPVHGCWGFA